MKYEVEEEFIKEAYSAACQVWKNKLEAKFPDVFRSKLYQNVLEVVKKLGKLQNTGESIKVEDNGYILVKLPLPTANNEWSLEVFKWAKNFMEEDIKGSHNKFIWHDSSLDNKNYLHIKII